MTVSGQFSCPPAGSFVAVSGQFLVSADILVGVFAWSLHTEPKKGPRHLSGTPSVTNLPGQNI